jgi:putative FmdB family regulatory protein
MPLYEYQCDDCGTRFEELTGQAESEVRCTSCRSLKTRRLVCAPNVKTSGKSDSGLQPLGAGMGSGCGPGGFS